MRQRSERVRERMIGFVLPTLGRGMNQKNLKSNTNSINDCNTSLGEDAMNRVSTNGLFVAFFF
ncbi:hypothetical protein [uncultured Nostoc sp.]|uniref:hypothetical protein n=1 Tax=uncultured Nostoc sp. TaxID=340711 RepID=UPI0035CC3E80